MGVKIEIPGVDVQGTLKPENLFDTLAALLSAKFEMQITVKTRPPAWMERAAQEEMGHDAEKVLSSRLPPDERAHNVPKKGGAYEALCITDQGP